MAREIMDEELVTVHIEVRAVDGEIMKSMLESYGIPVLLESDTITNSAIRTINVGSMGEIRLKVPASQAEEASNLLSSFKESLPSTVISPSLWRRGEAVEATHAREKPDDRSFRWVMSTLIIGLVLLAVWALWRNGVLS